MNERQTRIGLNEALFREVNERLREINEAFERGDVQEEFACECGNAECAERVRMTLAEYEQVRADPRQFIIVRGHETPDVEKVVYASDRYAVIEKRSGAPTELAANLDPRS